MKVLFLNPPALGHKKIVRNIGCSFESKANYLFQPQDFLLLSSFLTADDELFFWDFIVSPLNEKQIFKNIHDQQFELVIMMLADCFWTYDLSFLKKLRSHYKKTLWVAGDAFLDEENRSEANPFADAYIPHPFNLKIKSPISSSIGIQSLKEGPQYLKEKIIHNIAPKHELFLNQAYRWPFAKYKLYSNIFASWGCPYSCTYCPNSHFPFHQRTVSQVIDELKNLKKLNVKEFYLGDRSFGFPKDYCLELLREIQKEKLHFSWSCYFHPLHADEELITEMKASGCHTIIIGIEHHDQTKLYNYSRKIPQEKFDLLFRLTTKYKIDVCGDFIIGLPDQNIDDINSLIKLSCKLPLSYASFNLMTPLPGTLYREEVKKKIPQNERQNFDSLGKRNTFSSGKISAKDLQKIRNKAIFKFYTRPSYLFKRLLGIQSFEHFLIQFEEMIHLLKKAF